MLASVLRVLRLLVFGCSRRFRWNLIVSHPLVSPAPLTPLQRAQALTFFVHTYTPLTTHPSYPHFHSFLSVKMTNSFKKVVRASHPAAEHAKVERR